MVGRGPYEVEHEAEVVRRVAARTPAGLVFFLACVGLAAGFEIFHYPERRVSMLTFGAAFAVLSALTFAFVQRRPAHAVGTLVVFVNVIGVALNGYHALVGASVAMCLWTLTGLLGSAVVILPWSGRSQALASVGTLLSYPVHLAAGTDPITWATGGTYLLIMVGVGVFGAARHGQYVRAGLRLSTALGEREAQLQTYFDLALVGTAILSPDGRCHEANAELCRILGTTRERLLGTSWATVVHPDERHAAATALAAARAGGAPPPAETRLLRADGTALDASVGLRGLPGPAGTVDDVIAVVEDITERKRVESEREALLGREAAARRDAEAASRAKDEFLAVVSHELRTPLSPIVLWSDLLRRGALDDEETQRALAAISRNVGVQAQLIEDLLDVSRIVSGTLRLDRRPVDLVPVLRDAEEIVRLAARFKGVRLDVALDVPACRVSGDPSRLRQVFWNLLSNAVKFTPTGGRIELALRRDDQTARVTVRDTGRGIAPAFLPHVFDRFRQAEGTSTRKHGGLGIGLTIVRELVELHGGTVDAASDGEGRGATFTVTLPVAVGSEAAKAVLAEEVDTPADRPLAGLRVLLVDDDPDSNEVVKTLLTACAAEVRAAASVAEALDLLATWRPDVLVSDLAMPGEDGYTLIARLRARDASYPRVPAIALTAYAGPADRDHALSAGFAAHVQKPPRSDDLVSAIKAAARSVAH